MFKFVSIVKKKRSFMLFNKYAYDFEKEKYRSVIYASVSVLRDVASVFCWIPKNKHLGPSKPWYILSLLVMDVNINISSLLSMY